MRTLSTLAIGLAAAIAVAPAAFAGAPSASAVAQRLAALERRATAQQDTRDLENLQRIYGYYIDRGQWDQAADLFAANGTIELDQRGVYVGKARIRAALEDAYGPPGIRQGHLDDHLQLQVIATVNPDGRTASVRARELRLAGDVGKESIWGEGTYENRFVKEGGVWKFQSLHLFTNMTTDYHQGWGKNAKPVAKASAALPPDRPPTVTYESYPKQVVAPFHYNNPVTGQPTRYSGRR